MIETRSGMNLLILLISGAAEFEYAVTQGGKESQEDFRREAGHHARVASVMFGREDISQEGVLSSLPDVRAEWSLGSRSGKLNGTQAADSTSTIQNFTGIYPGLWGAPLLLWSRNRTLYKPSPRQLNSCVRRGHGHRPRLAARTCHCLIK
jgi:hypothetical protein